MDAADLSALSALAGSIGGGFTSGLTNWLNQRSFFDLVSEIVNVLKQFRDTSGDIDALRLQHIPKPIWLRAQRLTKHEISFAFRFVAGAREQAGFRPR
jgi:hypothetical protein